MIKLASNLNIKPNKTLKFACAEIAHAWTPQLTSALATNHR